MPQEDGEHKKLVNEWNDDIVERLGASSIPVRLSTEEPLEGQENINDSSIDSSSLRHVNTIRKSFEQGSRSPMTSFAFGEAFHKRQSQDRMGEKEKVRRAREAMHGLRESPIDQYKAHGEIDRSPLAKTFTFEGQARDDGVSSQDQAVETRSFDSRYKAAVFVVHETKGMLMLRQPKNKSLIEIPGGLIEEIEISRAALKNSHYKMQLQLAAREAASRHLYEQTGIDTRYDLERLQPAVLCIEPPLGVDGIRLLRNELEDSLYFLFRVSEEEQQLRMQNVNHNGGDLGDWVRVRGSDTIDPFIFVKEPEKAWELLNTHGEGNAALAFQMVIDESRVTSAAGLNDFTMQEHHELPPVRRPSKEMEPQSKGRDKRKSLPTIKVLWSAMLCFRKR